MTPILLIDDQQSILDDFVRLLVPADDSHADAALDDLSTAFGGTPAPARAAAPSYALHPSRQGLDGVALHARLVSAATPPAVAFVDIHMPPGIDGVETVARLWQTQPDLEVVLCTAYSDYSWHGIIDRL